MNQLSNAEQLYGGAFDGLEIETWHAPEFLITASGLRYTRRRDGKLYEVGCRWDEGG